MRLAKTFLPIVVLVLASAWPASAADRKHEIGLFFASVGPSGELATDVTLGGEVLPATIDLKSSSGVGVAYRYRINHAFSVGASLLTSKHDVEVFTLPESGLIGSTTFTPLLLDGSYHMLKKSKSSDLFLGATVGYAMWGDLEPKDIAVEFGLDRPEKLKSNFVYGLRLGYDFTFHETWAINAGALYLWAKADPEASEFETIDVDPLIFTVGVSYKF